MTSREKRHLRAQGIDWRAVQAEQVAAIEAERERLRAEEESRPRPPIKGRHRLAMLMAVASMMGEGER